MCCVLRCAELCLTVLCFALRYTMLCCTVRCPALPCAALLCYVLPCPALLCAALCCTALLCAVLCFIVLCLLRSAALYAVLYCIFLKYAVFRGALILFTEVFVASSLRLSLHHIASHLITSHAILISHSHFNSCHTHALTPLPTPTPLPVCRGCRRTYMRNPRYHEGQAQYFRCEACDSHRIGDMVKGSCNIN
jgi:hypothetical protein